jgi:hypothetical protein
VNERLSAVIHAVPRYARATNLERDSGMEGVADYHLIEPSFDVLRRVARAASQAFVVTGPYGSGKSTFALFLDALMGPTTDPVARAALDRLQRLDPVLAADIGAYKRRLTTQPSGPIRAIATGRPEPIADTALRALAAGVARHPRLPAALRTRIAAVSTGARPAEVASLFRDARAYAPVVLIIDELGVVLDAAAEAADDGLWLLQDLAEAMSNGPDTQGFILALQHRSLAEQIGGGRELPTGWRKIQGRFEEVAFVESRDAVFSLIPRVLQRSAEPMLDAAIARWADDARNDATRLGLEPFLPPDRAAVAGCYPLHPSVLLVLPDLTSYYGQRERTLLAFLAGSEPNAVGPFLDEHAIDELPLPSIDLPRVYEFFVGSGSHRLGSPGRVSRWAEVERRIREAGKLSETEGRVVRAIALLNLVGRGGAARASESVLEFAVPGSAQCLPGLVRVGLLTYRSTSDEYRIWEGSDLDIEAVLAANRATVETQPLASLLSLLAPLPPVVAASHSERTGVLRTFERQYLDASQSLDRTRDGSILYRVDQTPVPASMSTGLPVIVLEGAELERLRSAALHAAALERLLGDKDIADDWVALREIRERHGMALDALRGELDASFAPDIAMPTLLLDGSEEALSPGLLSRLTSLAADRAFPATPWVRNEMFSIHDLTKQGARARGLLISAMIEHAADPELGFVGWGPERAMYAAIFSAGGLRGESGVSFGPIPDSPYGEVWAALKATMFGATKHTITVDAVLSSVEARPYGLRRSLTPLLWLAVMLAEADQLALFERGTFLPRLAPDAIERLVKTPEAFTVRHFAARGARKEMVVRIAAELSRSGGSAATVVGVVSGLIRSLRRLPAYALRTHNLSDRALAVRAAVLNAREPDALLFEALPIALGYSPVQPDGSLPEELVDRLQAALLELSASGRDLHQRVRSLLAEAFDLVSGPTLRADLRVRSEPLLAHVIERQIRSFLLAATNTSLGDDEWLAALVVATGTAPLDQWDDEAEETFEAIVREIGRTHRRLAVLYAEAWAQELTEGFVARRVTITQADGHETSRLVWLDESNASRIAPIVDEAVRRVEDLAGPQASRMILALLTERLATEEQADSDRRNEDDRRLA